MPALSAGAPPPQAGLHGGLTPPAHADAAKSLVMSTATQSVTDDLRRWIVAQAEAGCKPQDVLEAMKASGWDEDVAIAAMEQTLTERLTELNRERENLPAATAVPGPAPGTLLVAGGREVKVLAAMTLPRVVVFGGLLSDEECDGLMALAAPRLVRSETVDNATGGSEINAARTSDGMFFERGEAPLIQRIEQRIAELVGWPLENGEGLQILRYRPGAEYKPHHDYFDPKHAGTARILQRGGQRVGTLVMYLNTPDGGGATTFPDVGFEVAPVRGNAVFFSYDRAHPATKTLHGGAPVTAGEKWVATKWLREGIFV
jgi:prolyl 4-hydroxylase